MYDPKVNDYVRWVNKLGQVHEGWVYFKASPVEHKKGWNKPVRYISIEIATKPRKQCDLTSFLHKKIHVCLCCYEGNWNQLEYIKRRISDYDALQKYNDRCYGYRMMLCYFISIPFIFAIILSIFKS
mgnify:CR=1 FL=1